MKTKWLDLSVAGCVRNFLGTLFAIVMLAGVSFAQSIPGTLSSVETTRTVVLGGNGGCTQTFHTWTWSFLDPQGAAHAFPGSSLVLQLSGGTPTTCPHSTSAESLSTWSTDGLYYLQGTVSGITITETVTLASGYISPKFLIMGVTYAPPGGQAASFVSYGDTTFVGNTSTNTGSFSNTFTESVSVSGGSCLGSGFGLAYIFGLYGGACVTGTQSSAWTQASNSSNSITVSKQTTNLLKTPGTPDVYSPVDHDYDIIWVWLNPVVTFNVPATNTSSSGSIIWTGYGYDYSDPLHEVDVWPVYVGYLNGDFGTSFNCGGVTQPIDCQDADAFSRSWVTTQKFASGVGPGITPADYPTMLSADPFAKNPAYLVTLASGVSPATTTDGRFTQAEENESSPETFFYRQAGLDSTVGENEMYADQYSDSTTLGKGASSTFTEAFGLEEKIGGDFFGLGVQYDFKQNWSYTWINTWQNTVTNTTTQVDTLSITSPPCPATVSPCIPQYTEPHEFAVYQDNLYGTFMFWPFPYFSLGPVAPVSQTVVAGGRASYTVPTAANAGYTGTLTSFNVAGLPSGATYSLSKSSGTPGFTSTLTVSTTSATPAGTYPLTISASDGSLSYFACILDCPTSEPYPTLIVSAAPGFTISLKPDSQTVGIGGSTTYTVTVAATNGFNGVVTLGVKGLPSFSSATFSPETVTGSGSSTLTLTTTASIQPGTNSLTFTGTSGTLNQSMTGTLVVTGANFSISSSPEIDAINAGSSAVYTVTVTGMNGFDGSVELSLPGLPSGTSATFSPTAISGSGSATLTITTPTSLAAGDYIVPVTGTYGTQNPVVQSSPITIEVNN
jgi:hypothetical protein